MSIFLPSNDNINRLKSLLMRDFDMKSSHATEAIAALAGFRSNASFRAHLETHNQIAAFRADFDRFEARAYELGYERNSSEYLRLIFNSLDLPNPAWKIVRKTDAFDRDRWFYACKDRKMPFIVIVKARTKCSLEWDHISMDSSYDKLILKSLGSNHGKSLLRLFQLLVFDGSPRAIFDGNAYVGSVANLSEADARILANEFALVLFPGNLTARISEAS